MSYYLNFVMFLGMFESPEFSLWWISDVEKRTFRARLHENTTLKKGKLCLQALRGSLFHFRDAELLLVRLAVNETVRRGYEPYER